MKKSHRNTILIGLFLLILMGTIESNLFVKRKTIEWNEHKPLIWNDFQGFPNYLTLFDAAISSTFDYKILGSNLDSIRINTIMFSHHSWAKSSSIGSNYLLKHEQSHFNLSECIARKFRKSVSEIPKQFINQNKIDDLYQKYINELNEIQDKYDLDTDHSLILERQKDWEYIIDSLLNEYSYYSKNIVVLKKSRFGNFSNYYRQIEINSKHQIVGKFPIDSTTAKHSKHYRFYFDKDKISKIQFWNRQTLSDDEFYNVASVVFKYEKNKEYRTYNDKYGKPKKNNKGVYTTLIEKDKDSLNVCSLDDKGQKIDDTNGVHKISWKLDYKDRKFSGVFYNKNGKQINDNEGFFRIVFSYDYEGNRYEYSNFDKNNKLCNNKDGIAFYRYFYDEKGNISKFQAFNQYSEPTIYQDNFSTINYHYDLDGNIIRQHYQKTDGSIYINEFGFAISYFRYDKYANLKEERHYGLNKNLIISKDKVGRVERDYDDMGRVIEVRNFDAYDNYLNDKMNNCKVGYTYFKNNNVSKEKLYRVDTLNKVLKVKTINYEYDKNDNIICKTYFDNKNKLLADSFGVCIERYKYDSKNNLLESSYYNSQNKLHPSVSGVAIFRYKYDERNNKIEIAYFDRNNKLKNTLHNIAIEKFSYNDKNLIIEGKYLNANEELTKNENGIEIEKWQYDNEGRTIKESYYNSSGNLTPNINGIAYYEFSYKNKTNISEVRCYNSNSNLVDLENFGNAIVQYQYSEDNLVTKSSYLDKNRNLINISEGYAIENNYYDKNRNLIRKELLSKDNKAVLTTYGYSIIEWKFDNNFNIIASIYKDEKNELIADDSGYAIYNWIYDRNGNIINTFSYNTKIENLSKINFGEFNKTIKNYSENIFYENVLY